MSFVEFEDEVEKLTDPKTKSKYIRVRDLHDLLVGDLKLKVPAIDEDLLYYYYRDTKNEEYFNYDKFLNKLSSTMKESESSLLAKPQLGKNISALVFSEDELKKILKSIALDLENSGVDLEEHVHLYDEKGILTETEFERCMAGIKLNLDKRDMSTLVNKYYNTIDRMVYVEQFLNDLKPYFKGKKDIGSREGRGVQSFEKSNIVKKVANYVTKKKYDKEVIYEMFMADTHSTGVLPVTDIKNSFSNAKVPISSSQLNEVLREFVPNKDGNYDYVEILIEMFGETSQIKKLREKMKKYPERRDKKPDSSLRPDSRPSSRPGSSKHGSRHRTRPKDEKEDRFGKKSSRRSSLSSGGLSDRSLHRDSNRREENKKARRGSSRASSGYDSAGSKRSRSGLSRTAKDRDRRGHRDRSEHQSRDGRGVSGTRRRDDTYSPKSRGDKRDATYSPRSRGSRNDSLNRSSRSRRDSFNKSSRSGRDSVNRSTRSRKNSFDSSPRIRDGLSVGEVKGDRNVSRSPNSRVSKDPRANEITSITRIVGTRIRNSNTDYDGILKKVSRNDPYHLITDTELLDALKMMQIKLEYNDETRLLTEIDTQNIRDERRKFSYIKFLEKAGIKTNLQRENSSAHIEAELTKEELRRGEDLVEEIKKELKYTKQTLYQIVDIRPKDVDIPWMSFKHGIEDNLGSFGIELTASKDKVNDLKLFLCGPGDTTIEIERLNKVFGIDVKREGDKQMRETHLFGEEKIHGDQASLPKRTGIREDEFSEEDEDLDVGKRREDAKKYGDEKLKLDDEGRMNMAVNDFLVDLKSREIVFEKDIANKAGFYSDKEFIALLQKIEYVTTSAEQLDLLINAFRDEKQPSKLSVNKMRQKFNTLDPTYLNKNAVKNVADAKARLSILPEKLREDIIRIDDYFKRKDIDLTQIFKEMDKNNDGTLSKEEFCRVLMRNHKIPNFRLEQFQEIYAALDINKDNSISSGEFRYFFEGAKRSAEDRKKQMSSDVKEQLQFEINKLFEEFDTQNKGFLVEDDLHKIFKASGVNVDRNTCKAIIRENDTDRDGKLQKKEFEKIMMEKMVNELLEDEDSLQDLNSMFHQFDINKDGYLTIDELDIMFKQSNANISYDELLSFMKEIDVDGDGRLDIDEFTALMTMDQSSFKQDKSSNTMMKIKKSQKKPAYEMIKYFKIMPNHFVESFTTRLWKKKRNLPSSVFEPKINPETLLYKDLKADVKPHGDKDNPLLAFQILIENATGVPFPPKDISTTGDFKVLKREVRVCLYSGRSGQYLANSARVAAIYDTANLDKWKFNKWGDVGPNPLIFTSKDEEIVRDDDVQIIFEYVMLCNMGGTTKDISCGFSSLPMKEFKDQNTRRTTFQLDIKGGSPDMIIDMEPYNYNQNMGLLKKIRRGSIASRIRISLRYFDTFSTEGKFNIAMLPSTCIINKKLLHF